MKDKNTRLVYSTETGDLRKKLEISGPPVQATKFRVYLDRKARKGKIVTLVEGVSHDALETHCKNLKGICGAGGTITEARILIQGDHCSKILEYFKKLGF